MALRVACSGLKYKNTHTPGFLQCLQWTSVDNPFREDARRVFRGFDAAVQPDAGRVR